MERVKQGAHTSIGTGHAGVPNPESMFEWDDTRSLTNIEKHGIQFEDAGRILASVPAGGTGADWGRIGSLEGRAIAVILTQRVDRRRLIAARRASRGESRA